MLRRGGLREGRQPRRLLRQLLQAVGEDAQSDGQLPVQLRVVRREMHTCNSQIKTAATRWLFRSAAELEELHLEGSSIQLPNQNSCNSKAFAFSC